MAAIVIVIFNQKGGVGKTTTTVNLAAGLALRGYRTCVVDADPQANATACYSNDYDLLYAIGDWMLEAVPLEKILIKRSKLLHLIPANQRLKEVAERLVTYKSREKVLSRAFRRDKLLDLYDFIIIDCPPSAGLLTDNALAVSDYYLVPLDAMFFSYMGFSSMTQEVTRTLDALDHQSALLGTLLIKYHPKKRNRSMQKTARLLRDDPEARLFETFIQQDEDFDQMGRRCKSIFDLGSYLEEDKNFTAGAKNYYDLTSEVLNRISNDHKN
jgi:chromosome partitioning protein